MSGRDAATAAAGLECVREPAAGEAHVDLVLVHGASGGAWLWHTGALDLLADAGFRIWARDGDGDAGGDLGAHADALAAGLDAAGRPCVVVAHSLGGAVAQRLLVRGHRHLAGTVLLCAVPPYGLARASAEMAWRTPRLWHEIGVYVSRGLAAADLGVIREGLFPDGVDDALFDRIAARLHNDPLAALWQTMGWPPFAPPPGPRRDVLVIGGSEDRFVPPTDSIATGWYFGGTAHLVPGAGHMLMAGPTGPEAAAVVRDWLIRLDPADGA